MPELPEVECVRQGLEELSGKRLLRVECWAADLLDSISLPLVQLKDSHWGTPERKGKYLRIPCGSLHLYAHLGMSGVFRIAEAVQPPKHTHLRIYFADGTELWYTDPRRFGWLCVQSSSEDHPRWAALGPDALSQQWKAAAFCKALAGRSAPIKSLLLDQSIVAGIGNIYACEALFLAGIHPQTPGGALDMAQCSRLRQQARAVMRRSLRQRGTTFSDYRLTNGRGGSFQGFLKVFQKEGLPCPICQSAIERMVQGGRSTFFCPSCQPIFF